MRAVAPQIKVVADDERRGAEGDAAADQAPHRVALAELVEAQLDHPLDLGRLQACASPAGISPTIGSTR